MGYNYLFALNHSVAFSEDAPVQSAGPDNPVDGELCLSLGRAIASFSSGKKDGWCPRDYSTTAGILVRRLALVHYDDTLLIEGSGFSFGNVDAQRFRSPDFSALVDVCRRRKSAAEPLSLSDRYERQKSALLRGEPPPPLDLSESYGITSMYWGIEDALDGLDAPNIDETLLADVGKQLLRIAANRYEREVAVGSYSNGIKKGVIIDDHDPFVVAWVHNGLHTFANLDEIHRRVLKTCGLSME